MTLGKLAIASLVALAVACGPARTVPARARTPVPAPTYRGQPPATTSSTGALYGVVVELDTGKPVVGATVMVTSPVLRGMRTFITEAPGEYALPRLPLGIYAVTVFYADAEVRREGVVVTASTPTRVDIAMDVVQDTLEVI